MTDDIPQSRRFRSLVLACVLPFAADCNLVAQDPAAALEDSIIKVVGKAETSVVSIARITPAPNEVRQNRDRAFPFHPHRQDEQPREIDIVPSEFGAGCLIVSGKDSERLVLTNYHVVRGGPVYPAFEMEDKTRLLVHFSDRRGCRGAIIAADPRSDLAVLRLNWNDALIESADFPGLDWETASPPRKGQFVILLGNPHAIARDGSASVSWGMVSNLTRQPFTVEPNDRDDILKGSMLYRLGAMMQLDARMNLGLSGGPVLNLKGELIGLGTSLAAIEGYEQSVGFAIPIDRHTRRIIRTLLAGQEVEYGMLGIAPAEIDTGRFASLRTGLPQQSAAVVHDVTQGSPAQLAGISSGDVILSVEGEPVRSVADLMRLVGLHGPDKTISIGVWRRLGGVALLPVRLGKWPVRDDEGIIETSPRYSPWRGLSVDYSTARERFKDPFTDSRRVLVIRVNPDSPAQTARIEAGNFITHVNETPVRTPAEFYAAVKSLTGTVSLRFSESHSGVPQGRIVKITDEFQSADKK